MEQRKLLIHIPKYVINDGATRMVRDYVSRTIHSTKVVSEDSGEDALPFYKWADCVLSHLGTTGLAVNTCKRLGKPLVFIAHNANHFGFVERKGIRVLNNSEHLPKYKNHSGVCRPMCVYVKGEFKGEYVTLVNGNKNKGGSILKLIAEAMPDTKFLLVKGGYGIQITDQPSNVKIVEHGHIDAVLQQTKILIMPSSSESWGRTAAEAITKAIPVISTPTRGVKECLGLACKYVERDNIKGWVQAITKIADNGLLKKLMSRRVSELKVQADKDILTFDKTIDDASKSNQGLYRA